MDTAIWSALIAVGGTISGGVVTSLASGAAARRTNRRARRDHERDEQIAAHAAFADALYEAKDTGRTLLYFASPDPLKAATAHEDKFDAHREALVRARQTLTRLRLLSDDWDRSVEAQQAFDAVAAVRPSLDPARTGEAWDRLKVAEAAYEGWLSNCAKHFTVWSRQHRRRPLVR